MPEEYVVSEKGPPARGMGTQNNVKMLAIPHSVGILGGFTGSIFPPLFHSSAPRGAPTNQISAAPHCQFEMAV